MIHLHGKHNTAIAFTDYMEESARQIVTDLLDNPNFKDSKIRFMPDIHTGLGVCIGTTMTISDKVVPNFVGVDIGCGMLVQELDCHTVDFAALDKAIRQRVPSGNKIHAMQQVETWLAFPQELKCVNHVNMDRALKSIGTLGGGNHFIELTQSDNGRYYLVIHSGSRHLGLQIAEHYQEMAYNQLIRNNKKDIPALVREMKAAGRESEIGKAIKEVKQNIAQVEKYKLMAYCEAELLQNYLQDMDIAQKFAVLNRKSIAKIIASEMRWQVLSEFQTIHNYIDTQAMILRKGAVSAKKGERFIVPINMRDGSLICVGKGNPDWNYSAPHGAGRLMSRTQARQQISLEEVKHTMRGVYTNSINNNTIDESPQAYKNMDEIVRNMQDTAEVIERIKPVYNFKDS